MSNASAREEESARTLGVGTRHDSQEDSDGAMTPAVSNRQ